MRLVIDLQGWQIRSGDVSEPDLTLVQALVRNRGEHEILLVLSGHFPARIDELRATFDTMLAPESIRVWHSPQPLEPHNPGNTWRREVATLIRDALIFDLRADVIFMPGIWLDGRDALIAGKGHVASTVMLVEGITQDVSPRQMDYLQRTSRLLSPPELLPELQDLGLAVEPLGSDAQSEKLLSLFAALDKPASQKPSDNRPRLAYISPLPPEHSGIAEYSAGLLPYLAAHYQIDVVISQPAISAPWVQANCCILSCEEFLEKAHTYQRVIYHFGNSTFHQHMFKLLEHVPGIVVLHDFYLGDIHNFLDTYSISPHSFTRALYLSHGYGAMAERFRAQQLIDVVRKYPANLALLRQAQAVIVHSQHACDLAEQWYNSGVSREWAVIPHFHLPSTEPLRDQARSALGINPQDFIISCFGLMGATKQNHRMLSAWLHSRLARDANCVLLFVGEEQIGEYGESIRHTIRSSGLEKRIRITGWTDATTFKNYLAASDVAVQLRTTSRGETSGAVLDCMAQALPTIVNAHGTFAELPSDAVWMLPDAFTDGQLIQAIETLWLDGGRRARLGQRALEVITRHYAPEACAKQYVMAIERTQARAAYGMDALIGRIVHHHCFSDEQAMELAQMLARTLCQRNGANQLLVDVSATCRNDLKTGIQRVVRALVWELIKSPPPGYRIEPVFISDVGGQWHYRYAREWTAYALDIPCSCWMADESVEYAPGDILLVADFTSALAVEAEKGGLFERFKQDGIKVHFFVYDLLPILRPEFFPPGQFGFTEWLNTVSRVADGAMCISRSVADDLGAWMRGANPMRLESMHIDWFHLGANIENSIPTSGIPKQAEKVFSRMNSASSFLMVGTVEPRKGYLQTLKAFSKLWLEGFDINLVVVGKEGWQGLPEDMRRTIPEIITQMRNHPELGKRFLWLEGISDEYLEKIYAASDCLIFASEGEGFGLPLIEAAQHKLPIIARDIPIFREIAGEHAYYFSGLAPTDLSDALVAWLDIHQRNQSPTSHSMPWLTWEKSVEMLVKKLGLSQ